VRTLVDAHMTACSAIRKSIKRHWRRCHTIPAAPRENRLTPPTHLVLPVMHHPSNNSFSTPLLSQNPPPLHSTTNFNSTSYLFHFPCLSRHPPRSKPLPIFNPISILPFPDPYTHNSKVFSPNFDSPTANPLLYDPITPIIPSSPPTCPPYPPLTHTFPTDTIHIQPFTHPVPLILYMSNCTVHPFPPKPPPSNLSYIAPNPPPTPPPPGTRPISTPFSRHTTLTLIR